MIPALSLHRPWTTLILRFAKDVENRTWRTNYRGPLLIHGAKAWSDEAIDYADTVDTIHDGELGMHALSPDPDDHPTGIVGVVDLVGICVAETHAHTDPCTCSAWGMIGNFHWKLANPRLFAAPIPCRGWQQLWTPKGDVAAAVERELEAVDKAGVR